MRIIIRPKLLNRVLAQVAVPTSLPPDGGRAQVARVASKLAPKKYGDNIDATLSGPEARRMAVSLIPLLAVADATATGTPQSL